MAKHNPNKVWDLRKDGESNGYVMTISDKKVHVYYYESMDNPTSIVEFDINRTDARLLARRILECLEGTK